jgi:hypothetical protein
MPSHSFTARARVSWVAMVRLFYVKQWRSRADMCWYPAPGCAKRLSYCRRSSFRWVASLTRAARRSGALSRPSASFSIVSEPS